MENEISLIIITYNRIEELKQTIENVRCEEDEYLELIIIDNASNDETEAYGKELQKNSEKIHYYRMEKNLGVAGGRNYAIRKAKGEILVFIDDDAVWEKDNNLTFIKRRFSEDANLGVLAFKIVNYYTSKVRREEFPFTNKSLNENEERLTSTYIGAGHAIRRSVFEKCGLYPEEFFYGGEELDLSFRIINKQYLILYCPNIVVLHKQSPKGRMRNDEKWIMVYRNRLIMGYKYLRWNDRLISAFLWFLKIALITKSIRIPICAIVLYNKTKNPSEKVKLNKKALEYMKKNHGRLKY